MTPTAEASTPKPPSRNPDTAWPARSSTANEDRSHQAYREGQEDQLGVLGIVVNAITLWNTRYLDAAVTQLRDSGYPAQDEDVARLSPLGYAHLNELGRYSFPTLPPGSGLRPLRDPAAIADGYTEEPSPSIAIPV